VRTGFGVVVVVGTVVVVVGTVVVVVLEVVVVVLEVVVVEVEVLEVELGVLDVVALDVVAGTALGDEPHAPATVDRATRTASSRASGTPLKVVTVSQRRHRRHRA
jgi:hypothetical protein